jgi:acetyltransferase-like isoleucine patch superfamily enzyme
MKLFGTTSQLVTREEIVWCYRNLLGREPESEEAIFAHAQCKSFKDLVAAFTGSAEFLARAKAAGRPPLGWRTPPPADGLGEKRTLPFAKLPGYCFKDRRARQVPGVVSFPAGAAGKLRLLKISFHGHEDPARLEGVEIDFDSVVGLRLHLAAANARVKVGEGASGRWELKLFRNASVEIGRHTSCNEAKVLVDDGELVVGEDCMFAESTVQVGDNHALFDVASGELLNTRRARVVFEPHVWVAMGARVVGDAHIGAGSVVAAGALVKGDVPRCSLVAGVPARVVKSGVSWTRSPGGEDRGEVAERLAALGPPC